MFTIFPSLLVMLVSIGTIQTLALALVVESTSQQRPPTNPAPTSFIQRQITSTSTTTSAFLSSSFTTASTSQILRAGTEGTTMSTSPTMGNEKEKFLRSLDRLDSLNQATKERTKLVQEMVDNKMMVSPNQLAEEEEIRSTSCKSLERPGLRETFSSIAEGNWKVIYAPHMTTMAGLFGGDFDVQYNLHPFGKMESHARYDFPILGKGYLSVSGTYDSVDENVSRVDFDKAWIRTLGNNDNVDDSDDDKPYISLNDVPGGTVKELINAVGKTMFIEQFSVFPISFLDDNLIVFDFPLLGTRICAMKQL